jgi:hypothetical protein
MSISSVAQEQVMSRESRLERSQIVGQDACD